MTVAMILAAGRGQRLRPLTDHTPKPLVKIGKYLLIEHHLFSLAASGYRQVIINLCHLGEKIIAAIGNGDKYNVDIHYSWEQPIALETAGGIRRVLPLFGDQPFLVVNGDIRCNFDFSKLTLKKDHNMQLVLVPNPDYRDQGDFSLADNGSTRRVNALQSNEISYTFSGIGLYRPSIFTSLPENTPAPLAPIIHQQIHLGQVGGEIHSGKWFDIGTPSRLESARQHEQV